MSELGILTKVLEDMKSILHSAQWVNSMVPDNETNLSSSDILHNDSNFGFTLNEEIKQGSITQCLSKDLEDMTREHLNLMCTCNEGGYFNHNMERLSWYNTDEISTKCFRALPNKDGIIPLYFGYTESYSTTLH